MNQMYLTIIWIGVTLLFIAFFEGIEIAFVSVNRLQIELRKKQGRASGIIISRFMEEPSRFIGTCLLGVNISIVIYALLFSLLMEYVGIHNTYLKLALSTVASTFIVVVLGQFIPKAFFRARNDALLEFFAPVAQFFYKLLYPTASVLVSVAEWVLKYVFNVKVKDRNDVFNSVDLEQMFQQNNVQDEESQQLNTEMFENALSLPMVKIRQCLVPRTEIDSVDIQTSISDVKDLMIKTKLSKLIVYDDNIDNILGYVHQLDLFKSPPDIQSVLIPISAVPESMSATDLINKFSKERKSLAWVVDEFGGTAGIVTMEDVLEEIFGEIRDEYDVEEFVSKQIAEDEYLFSGRLELDYIREKFDLDFSVNGSETLSGFIIEEHKAIPRQKERIIIDMYEFEVLNVSDTRIEMVKLKVLR